MAKHATEEGNRILEEDRTARACPLCGTMVEGSQSVCPRCKSRMDAQPDADTPLADAFTEDGKLLASAAARLTGTPEDTQPLPVLSLGPEPPVALNPAAPEPITALESPAPVAADATPTASPAPKRRGKRIAAGIAAGFATLAFLAGGVFLANQANALNQITDDLVEADIRAEESFTTGSAADDFVTPTDYTIDAVFIDSKEVLEGGVEVRATVRMSNSFFEESRKAVLMYQKTEEGWKHSTTVASHTVKPIRGIDHDDEYDIANAETAFDGTSSCQVSIPIEGQPTGSWFATTRGTRIVSYTFTNDAWARTNVDDSQITTSYQGLVGTYATTDSTSRGLVYFAISSVDDASATFEGQYAWKEADGFFSTGKTTQGTFTGSIDSNGNLASSSSGQIGELDFAGNAAGDQTLHIEVTNYGEPGFWSLSGKPSTSLSSVTLQKQTSEITGWQDSTSADASDYDSRQDAFSDSNPYSSTNPRSDSFEDDESASYDDSYSSTPSYPDFSDAYPDSSGSHPGSSESSQNYSEQHDDQREEESFTDWLFGWDSRSY